jgi:hypothetical protein
LSVLAANISWGVTLIFLTPLQCAGSVVAVRLRTMVHRLATALARDGKVEPGLTIDGLRHSLGKELYDLGVERDPQASEREQNTKASKLIENERLNADRASELRF